MFWWSFFIRSHICTWTRFHLHWLYYYHLWSLVRLQIKLCILQGKYWVYVMPSKVSRSFLNYYIIVSTNPTTMIILWYFFFLNFFCFGQNSIFPLHKNTQRHRKDIKSIYYDRIAANSNDVSKVDTNKNIIIEHIPVEHYDCFRDDLT